MDLASEEQIDDYLCDEFDQDEDLQVDGDLASVDDVTKGVQGTSLNESKAPTSEHALPGNSFEQPRLYPQLEPLQAKVEEAPAETLEERLLKKLQQQGLASHFAEVYAKSLSLFLGQMREVSDRSIEKLGILNADHRATILNVIRLPEFMKETLARSTSEAGDNSVTQGNKKEKLLDDPLAQCWLDAMMEAGFSAEVGICYSNCFVRHGIDDAVALTLTPEKLQEIGVENEEDRTLLLEMVERQAAEWKVSSADESADETHDDEDAFHDDFLGSCWYEVLREYGLSRKDSVAYAKGFSNAGINQDNASEVTDEVLEEYGVQNAEHRSLLLRIIQDLLRSMGEDEQSKMDGEAPTTRVMSDEELRRQELKNDKLIQQYEVLERKLADIFAGNTGES